MLGEVIVYVFCGPREAFDRQPRKVLAWAMSKNGMPEGLVRSVMSLYVGEKARVKVDSELSEKVEVNVGMHQGSVLLHFLFAVVVDITDFASLGELSELLYADDSPDK